ncbi:hypothetical protein KAH55_04815, partial [bacterium]|nr:hypothetical protein [bacterium]
MQTNYRQLWNWKLCLVLVTVLVLLVPQTGWARWKIEDWEQAKNDDGDGPYTWVNGNLTQTQSKYFEGDAVPFRLHMSGLTVGSHTLEIKYQCTKGGKMAYDYLVSWDHSETTAPITADIDVSSFTGPTLFTIPEDPNITGQGVAQLPGNFTLYNGTITAFSAYSHDGDPTADCFTRFTITFTADGPDFLMAWGGHISTQADWGDGNSAVYIHGSPYHMILVQLDGAPTGSKDLQMAAAVIEVTDYDFGDAPDSYGTSLAANGANHLIAADFWLGASIDPEPDGFPTIGATGDDLNGSDDEDGVTFPVPLVAGLPATIAVDGGPSGGELDAWIDFNGNGQFDHPTELLTGATIILVAGANVVPINVPVTAVPGITYARFRLSTAGSLPPDGPADDGEVEDYTVEIGQQPGTIIIEKQTLPDGATETFEFSPSWGTNFTLRDNRAEHSGPLAPGSYSASEINLPPGWDLTDISIVDPSGGSSVNNNEAIFDLAAGEVITATFTNTLKGTIIIEKQTLPDGAPDLFEFTGDASGLISDDQQITVNDLAPGQYNAQELIPPGWTLTDISVDDGNSTFDLGNAEVTFNLEAGETVKATFTNTQKGTIIIEKQTDPDGAVGSFEFTGDVTGSISDNQQIKVENLIPGQYTAEELVPGGWELTSVVLDDNNSSGDVNTATANFVLDPGETVKAVFTNTLNVTEIDVEKDAEVFWERTYEWDIEKTVTPTEWHLFHGESGESQYTVTVTRSVLSDMVTVSGQICVTNTGQIATSGLMYIDTLQYRTPQMNDWGVIEISSGIPAAIPAGETDCYQYQFTFEVIPDAEYRNVAVARISNFDGHEGEIFGPRFVIPVNLPQLPNKENNPIVHVVDTNGMKWEFTNSDSETYTTTFLCDEHEG